MYRLTFVATHAPLEEIAIQARLIEPLYRPSLPRAEDTSTMSARI